LPHLEIACFDISSAIAAAQAGADRIELCDNAAVGGTTSSYGTIKLALEKISVPVFPIIRPRGGDFLYTDAEFKTMVYDVELCRELGCKGVVLGLLQQDGNIDTKGTRELVEIAGEMEVTFHRAFDRAASPLQALEDVIATGCKRLLTSGQKENAWDGKDLIRQLVKQANGRMTVMPGSGIRSGNILELIQFTGVTEMHSSARMLIESPMNYRVKDFEEDLKSVSVNEEEIRQMKAAISQPGGA
jgi:copper homeostasis protein